MSLPIAPNAGGLKNKFAFCTRNPMRRGVERIAFGEFVHAAFAMQTDADVRRSVFVQDAESEVTGLAGDREMTDARAVVIPQTALIRAQFRRFEQRAEASTFQ